MAGNSKKVLSADKINKYALVEWLEGADKGARSIIETSWIVAFNYEKWKSEPEYREAHASHIAEWRKGKKNSVGKYNAYDCKVLDVSGSQSKLKDTMLSLELQEKEENANEGSDQANSSGAESNDEDDNILSTVAKESKEVAKKKKSVQSDDHAVKSLQIENARLRELLVNKDVAGPESLDNANKETGSPAAKKRKSVTLVPIHKNSNYFVDSVAYEAAKACKSPNRFVNDMLVELFPAHVLVVSNIKGGSPKLGDHKGECQRWALHKKRRLSIFTAANQLFNSTEAQVNRSILFKINNIRAAYKAKGTLEAMEAKGREELSSRAGYGMEHAGGDSSESEQEQ